MGERSYNIGNHWRLGLAVPLLAGGFFYEANAADQSSKGNTPAAIEFGLEGALLLGTGSLLVWRDNEAEKRRMARILSVAEPIEGDILQSFPLIELESGETSTLSPSDGNPETQFT